MARVSLLALLLLLALPHASLAEPTDPIAVDPIPELGESFSPGVRLVADLEQAYVEEELLISGSADLHTYEDPPVRGEVVVLEEDVDYTTRVIVRRPADPADFNGTVIIEWWNTTATFDTAPVWDPAADYIARSGIVYIGLTNSNQGMSHLVGGCSLFGFLPPTCTGRYADLVLPDDGLAYDVASQLAHSLRSGIGDSPLPAEYVVEQVLHAGQSQQGGSMIAYANNFHFDGNDGYFVQAARGSRSVCGTRAGFGQPPVPLPPGCIGSLAEGDDHRVRTDLPVPVYQAMTETDVTGSSAFQPDTDVYRYYEMAGTAHATVHEDIEILPGLLLETACLFPLNTLADGPVRGDFLHNAMWDNMQRHVAIGKPPPPGLTIDRTPEDEIARDVHGNALGGIRLPYLEVPTATYGPRNAGNPETLPGPLILLGNLFCVLSGTVADFDLPTLASLYPNHKDYVKKVKLSANGLINDRYVLPEDALKMKVQAQNSAIGCGLGFELAFLLPPLMWLRSRRRARRVAASV